MPKIKPDQLRPLRTLILVKKYTKPERIGRLYVNPAWRVDNSRALWELVKSTPAAEEVLGTSLDRNCIVVTRPYSGVYVKDVELPKREDGSRPQAFLIDAKAVEQVIFW